VLVPVGRTGRGFFGYPDNFEGFDEMRKEMENVFKEANIPKDLVKEYQTSAGLLILFVRASKNSTCIQQNGV
jgi:hypothetical protein